MSQDTEYKIYANGIFMGVYSADSRESALDAYALYSGHDSFKDLQAAHPALVTIEEVAR